MRECPECQHLRASCAESSARLVAARQRLAQYRMPEVSPAFQSLSLECRQALAASRILRQRLDQHLHLHPATAFPKEPA